MPVAFTLDGLAQEANFARAAFRRGFRLVNPAPGEPNPVRHQWGSFGHTLSATAVVATPSPIAAAP